MPASRPSVPALTSLRFFAALVVVFYHYDTGRIVRWAIFDLGYEAVTFFFILSGFILTYVHCDETDARQLNVGTKTFLVARAARILPAYYVALILAAPFFVYSFVVSEMLSGPLFLAGLVTLPLLLQAWFPTTALLWNAPAWSLSVEALFYCLFPAICRYFARLTPTAGLASSFAVVVAVAVLRQILLPNAGHGFESAWHKFVAYFPLFHLPQFILGVALGRCFIRHGSAASWRTCETLLIAGLVGLGAVLLLKSTAQWMLSAPVLAMVFGAIIFGSAGGDGLVTRALSTQPFVLLGEASYATYITHLPLNQWWQWGVRKHLTPNLSAGADLTLYLISVIALSLLILIAIERPARAGLLARFAKTRVPEERHRPASVLPN